MGEISQNAGQNSGGKIRSKKQSTKIDMTPMVDLAFLLLTFFILTTTFNKPQIMQVDMPDKSDRTTTLMSADNILNLMLAEDNKIYWWMGLEPKAELTNYSSEGVRKLILEKKNARKNLMVLIKPKDKSKYENMVDILDEMTITGTERYAVMDVTEDDLTRQ